jgi:hypothetical protein
MTTVITHEEVRGGAFDYGGDPPAPVAVRVRVVQFFDDGSTREIWRDATLTDVFSSWDAALLAQRDAAATAAGEKTVRVQELEAALETATAQNAVLTTERDQARAQYEQLLSEVEPV